MLFFDEPVVTYDVSVRRDKARARIEFAHQRNHIICKKKKEGEPMRFILRVTAYDGRTADIYLPQNKNVSMRLRKMSGGYIEPEIVSEDGESNLAQVFNEAMGYAADNDGFLVEISIIAGERNLATSRDVKLEYVERADEDFACLRFRDRYGARRG